MCCPTYTLWLQVCWEKGWGLGVYSERAREVSPPDPLEQRKEWLVSYLEEGYSSTLSMSLWFLQASFQILKYRCCSNFSLQCVQSPTWVWLLATPWPGAHQASLSLTISQNFSKFKSIASVMLSSHLILWCPHLLLPSIFPSIRDLSIESAICVRWPNYWSFIISPSNEYSELISLRIDWFHLLAVKAAFRSFSSTTVWRHQFFGILLLYGPAFTTVHDHWDNHSLDYMDLVGRVMSLLFSTLSGFVIAFLPRRNCLLIS